MVDNAEFDMFMTNNVAARLHDDEGTTEFKNHLMGLASTGFGRNSLNEILEAEVPEERDWAIGESLAESFLSQEQKIIWPWNMERDKRHPSASLSGADLVGFELDGENVHIALGEVKTSTDVNTPPGVMNGRSGMTHQIDNLATDLSLVFQLLKWLWPRCKGTVHEKHFDIAVGFYLESSNKAVALFGILIRDTNPNELDLKARGHTLAGILQIPTTCRLIAIYLPCAIADLPKRVAGGAP